MEFFFAHAKFAYAGCAVFAGLALLFLGISWWRSVRHFIQTAERAEGTVIKLAECRSGKRVCYKPVVEFTDRFGQRQEFQSHVGSRPPDYSIGDKVQILYDQNKVDSARIDHWLSLYSYTLLCLLFAVGFIAQGILIFFGWLL